jgi:hypothetical protein
MRTWTRLAATRVARPNHSGASFGRPSLRSVAATKAAEEWPLGKLEVRGVRRWNGRGISVIGRVRRKSALMPTFTRSDSAARLAERRAPSRRPAGPESARSAAIECHRIPWSARAEAV